MAYKKFIRFVFILSVVFSPVASFGDSAVRGEFNGIWVGSVIHDDDGYTMDIRLDISGNTVVQYFKNDDGTWNAVIPDDDFFIWDRNNFVYAWVNKGGVWSETQIYSLSFINNRTLDVIWLRHVNNYKDGANNESWHLTGEGRLRKER
ncbi:MAG: hypothetical protein LBK62_13875 [Treponema sp.]|nr:hypothetical protein [Treponema sp.]